MKRKNKEIRSEQGNIVDSIYASPARRETPHPKVIESIDDISVPSIEYEKVKLSPKKSKKK